MSCSFICQLGIEIWTFEGLVVTFDFRSRFRETNPDHPFVRLYSWLKQTLYMLDTKRCPVWNPGHSSFHNLFYIRFWICLLIFSLVHEYLHLYWQWINISFIVYDCSTKISKILTFHLFKNSLISIVVTFG